MPKARPSDSLADVASTVRDDLIARLLAFDPTRTIPSDPSARAAAILDDGEAIRREFLTLSPVARTAVAALAQPRLKSELAAIVLARHGDATGDVGDRELGCTIGETLVRWPVLTQKMGGAHASNLLFPGVTQALGEHVHEALAIPKWASDGHVPDLGVVARAFVFALTPGLVVQRGARLTKDGELHAADAAKLGALIPDVARLTHVWWRWGAVVRDNTGSTRVRVEQAIAALEDAAGMRLLETLRGDRIAPTERWLVAVASAADEGDTLDLAATTARSGAPHGLYSDRFRVLVASPKDNRLALPRDVHRMLAGRGPDDDDAQTQRSWVKSDFEIVLATSTPLADAIVIGCSAELLHVEKVARLRLTHASVRKACAIGISLDMLTQALERATKRAIPAGVATALGEWSADLGHGALTVAYVLALSGSAAQLDRAATTLGELVHRRPAPDLFLLHRVPTPKQIEALVALGISVTNEVDPYVASTIEQYKQRVAVREPESGAARGFYVDHSAVEEVPIKTVRFVDAAPRAIDVQALLQPSRIGRVVQWWNKAAPNMVVPRTRVDHRWRPETIATTVRPLRR